MKLQKINPIILPHILLVLLLVTLLQSNAQQGITNISIQPFSIGQEISFNSSILGEERVINVYLPEGYSAEKSTLYPVIYLLDGTRTEDFIHIAGLVQFGSFPWVNFIPESIVVGIANIDRKRDFSFPSSDPKDTTDFPTSGGSANFIVFIEKELIPFVENQFRCSGERTLIGQSLGGLLATEILYKHNQLFDNYLVVSPSLWWDSHSSLNWPVPSNLASKKIFLTVGKEGEMMENCAQKLSEILLPLCPTFKFIKMPEFNHGDILHQAAYFGFMFLFGK